MPATMMKYIPGILLLGTILSFTSEKKGSPKLQALWELVSDSPKMWYQLL
jgi:hypothetical protein